MSFRGFKLKFTFDGNPSPAFESKILKKFEEYYLREIPELNQLSINLSSHNTFPHSCGIASSASFYASLALNLTELEGRYDISSPEFFKRASSLESLR